MISDEINDITGLEAFLLAVEDNGVQLVTGVAGFPTTLLIEKLVQTKNVNAFWMTNEKSALEKALGASVTGQRALVIVKHVGMNVLSDPLITATYHTIGAGVVILAGDDVGALASQNAQDSRFYGSVAQVAVFDPSTVQEAYDIFTYAYELSEKSQIPIIIRITPRLLKSTSTLVRTSKDFDTKLLDSSIWTLTTKGKHQRFHNIVTPLLQKAVEESIFNKIRSMGNKIGIISSGYVSTLVSEVISNSKNNQYDHLSLQMTYPFAFNQSKQFIDTHEILLVIEESEPYIESHIAITKKVKGKFTGHIPYGQIETIHIEHALKFINTDKLKTYNKIQTIASRGSRPICADCPFMPIYRALALTDVMVAGDMGCSIKAAPSPLNAIDVSFALGSAISTACGFRNKGVAVIGDFALSHSGIIGLINAVENKDNVVIIVLQNDIAAMTGGQNSPNLINIIKELVQDITLLELMPYDRDTSNEYVDKISKLITSKINIQGINVIYATGLCIKYKF